MEGNPAMTDTVRIPPQNLDAERSLIACLLHSLNAMDEILGTPFRPEHLYLDAHQKIFAAIAAKYDKGASGVDPVIVAELLKKRGELEEVGGVAYLLEVLAGEPHEIHAKRYASIVTDCWIARQAVYIGTDLTKSGYDNPVDLDERIVAADTKLTELIAGAAGVAEDSGQTYVELLHDLQAESDLRTAGKLAGIPTGFADLDELTPMFQPGTLTYLAARASIGKTSLAMNFMLNELERLHKTGEGDKHGRILFVSAEQGKLRLAARTLSITSGVPLKALDRGTMNGFQRQEIIEATEKLGRICGNTVVYLDNSHQHSVATISAAARRIKRKHGLRMVIVDHIGILEPPDRRASREQQVSTMSRHLKLMSGLLACPVLCICQLNREMEKRNNRKPRLSDLRESGSLEQDADVVLLIDVPSKADEAALKSFETEMFLWVAKNRDGECGEVHLHWKADSFKASNAARQNQFDYAAHASARANPEAAPIGDDFNSQLFES